MEVATTPEFAANLNDQAVRFQAEGQYLEADKLYKNSLAIWESVLGLKDPLVAQSLANRAALYRLMGELVARGAAIVMISSELPEILGLSDRILVMRDGRICGEFDRANATEEKVLNCALRGAA